MKLISTVQAADIVGCSRQTIWDAIRPIGGSHFPTAMKAGRMWLLDIQEVEAFRVYLENKRRQAQEGNEDE